MRKLVPLALFLLLTATGTGAVSYEIAVEDETAQVNVSFDVYGQQEFQSIRTNWRVGEDATVTSVRDGGGQIQYVEDYDERDPGTYTKEDEQLRIHSNRGQPRRSSTIEIRYTRPIDIETWHGDLNVLEMQLSGFRERFEEFDEEQTYVQITVDEDIIGLSQNFGFRSSYDGRTGTFSGDGPINLKVVYSDREGQYENFIAFGDANLTAADDVYPLARLVTGRDIEHRKLPVIILNDSSYTQHLDAWSAGRYRRGGLIFIRKERVESDDFTGLIMHEVMHAFNEEPLRWVETDVALFDEGTAKYVEYIVNENMGLQQAEIFGGETTWRGPCSDGSGQCQYTLPPRGTPDDLWAYHQNDRTFMSAWSPSDTGTVREGLTLRTFGYAYAELLIRDLIRRKGPLYLHEVYESLDEVTEAATTGDAYASTLEDALGTDLRPCDELARNAMERCLEAVHDHQPRIPDTVDIDGPQENITFHRVEVPDAAASSEDANSSLSVSEGGQRLERSTGMFTDLLGSLRDAATNLINRAVKLLR